MGHPKDIRDNNDHHGIDTKRHRLLVPLFKENKVVILPY